MNRKNSDRASRKDQKLFDGVLCSWGVLGGYSDSRERLSGMGASFGDGCRYRLDVEILKRRS